MAWNGMGNVARCGLLYISLIAKNWVRGNRYFFCDMSVIKGRQRRDVAGDSACRG